MGEESSRGLTCIAAPVFSHDRLAVMALSVMTPGSRHRRHDRRISAKVMAAADDLSRAINASPSAVRAAATLLTD